MNARVDLARVGALMALVTLSATVVSCGGGGGGSEPPPPGPPAAASCSNRVSEFVGVCSGFPDTANLDWNAGGDGSGGTGDGGATGDGGVGAGGDFGQFRNVTLSVFKDDGSLLGSATTDSVKGMVTIRQGTYRGSLRVELRGGAGAEYFEEGKNTFVPFPADRVIRVIVPRVDKNIGITAFTEAAYQLLTQGTAPESVGGNPTPAQINAANLRVAQLLNEHVPKALEVADITRLPFIKSASVASGSLAANPRGVYGVVNGAFSKQAALFNTGSSTPTLDAVSQLAEDLRDGVLDGRNGNAPAAPAARRTYDPQTLTGELTSALAHQAERFGNQAIKDTLPQLLNFGGTRYEGYLFDSSVPRTRRAVSTVAGWLAGNSLNFTVGQALPKALPAGQSVSGMISNFGHGGAFFKIDNTDTTADPVYRVYALGDNSNGELGTGNQTSTNRALVEITLPGPLTHAAGGFAHTVFRLADGRVFASGDNSFGQLGQGVDSSTLQRSATPLLVNLPAAAGGAVAVAATSVASYALMADGTVYAWGSNGGFGLLGSGQATGLQTTPVPVTGLSDIVQITARDNDVAVLRRDQAVLQWGSHPADVNAYTDGDVTGAYRGGTLTPTLVAGLPTRTVAGRTGPVAVRKLITEQGLFAALLANGQVYTWGVHFDLSAKAVLRDLTAARVLGLPPLRDMMPGGFVGYGARPFDRLTAMGVDYSGGMWKVRGRVAERFDPTEPTLQRRPQTGVPRSVNCASCHTYLDQTLETLRARQLAEAPIAASAAVCTPPSSVHVAPNGNSFIHAETECIQCHNPARNDAAYVGIVTQAFVATGGWPNCNKPGNLPARITVAAATLTASCTVPVGHTFTPPGTVCSSCHNSVAARALQDLTPPCVQPGSSQLPTLPAVATITAVTDRNGASVAQGAYVRDTAPRLQGTLGAALSGAQTLAVSRNGTVVGNAVASGTGWTFADSGAPQGTVVYTARVVQGSGFGATSNTFTLRVDTVPPTATAQISSLNDDTFGAIVDGGFATDSTPTLAGTLSAAPDLGDVLQVLRNGAAVGNATVNGTGWTFTEATPLGTGSYSYQARLVDAAGNTGSASATRSFTLIGGVPGATITAVLDDANATIVAGSVTRDATPALSGTLTATLPTGHSVRVLRSGSNVGTATVSGTSWSFTDSAPQGAVSYSVRVEAGAVIGGGSAAYAFSVDSIAPTQLASVTQISDDFVGALAAGATTADQTPAVAGTLSAVLASDEQLRLRRTHSGTAAVADIVFTTTGTSWSYTETSLLPAGTYTYQAQVFDAAGNTAAFSATRAVTIDPTAVPLPGAAVTLSTVNGITPNSVTGSVGLININTPTLIGTLQRALNSGEVVRVFRNGTAVGAANVSGQAWSFVNTLLPDGNYTFSARVEQGSNSAVFGQSSATASASIDATAPTQVASISGIFDDFNVAVGGNNTADNTPRIAGTLNAVLGTGETVELVRTGGAGTVTRTATVSGGTNWSLQEVTSLAAAPYAYTVRVLDLAGNRGPASSASVTVIAALPAVTTIEVAYSAGLASPRADGTVVGNGGSIADTSPTVQGTLSAVVPAGASVRVYRTGTAASIGTATVVGTNWSFVDSGLTSQGLRTFTARVENGTAYGNVSSAYQVTVDTVAPTQTLSITAGESYVAPNTPRPAGSVELPVDFVIPASGQTNEPSPGLRVQLSAPLGTGESLIILRNGVQVSLLGGPVNDCGTNCYRVRVASGFSIPDATTSSPNLSNPIGSASYTARVQDAAGNFAASAAFSITFNYFTCDIARANATHLAMTSPPANHPAWAGLRCAGCHVATNTAVGATPAGTLLAVPKTTPTYWCRRP